MRFTSLVDGFGRSLRQADGVPAPQAPQPRRGDRHDATRRSVRLRRTVALVSFAAFGLVAPGGGPASAADAIATVNGVDISIDDFEATLGDLGASGTVTGEEARAVLTQMIRNEAVRQRLVAEGVDPDASGDDPEATGLVADRDRYAQLLGETDLVDASALQDEYEATGAAGGLMCLRLFIVDDVDAGEEAMAELADGAEFAEVAADYDDAFTQTEGSVMGDPNQLCFDPSGLSEAAAPIVEAVSDAGAGQPVGPIETEVATVVAIAPPFEEVSDELDDNLVGPVVADIAAAAEVTVAARYGRWDEATATVVALGQPVPPEPSDP